MATIVVLNKKGEKVDSIKLNENIFNGKVNKPLLQQVVSMYLANQRSGTASVKDRQQVSGGGKKPWRQKGTGRARHSSIRSPLWRHGGVTFGPKPKDWSYQMPKKMKRLALISSLNAKINDSTISVIDDLKLDSHKTKEMVGILKNLKLDSKKTIIIGFKADDNLKKAARNIDKVELMRVEDINAYKILVNDQVLVEKKAMERIEKELEKVV